MPVLPSRAVGIRFSGDGNRPTLTNTLISRSKAGPDRGPQEPPVVLVVHLAF